jgi:hypothetical protein
VTVEVPEEFRRIGYSGMFTVEAEITDATPTLLDEWTAKVPCLLPGDGWLALAVDLATRTITLVRRDSAAVVDVATGGRPR